MLRFQIARSGKAFARDESGVVTTWALGWTIAFLIIGGLTIDAGNAWRMRVMLQATADAAALAGAIELSMVSDEDARVEAIRVAGLNLPEGVLVDADISSGKWDMDDRTLDGAATLKDAVQVVTRRSSTTENPLPTYVLKLIGIGTWNVETRAVAQRFVPGCIRSGLIARGRVEVSSNNDFLNGICVHGQGGVKISSNNYFDESVQVTMPDLGLLQLPNSGFETNEGLANALGEDWIDPKIVDHVNEIVSALGNPASSRQPSYVDPAQAAIAMNRTAFNNASSFTPGRVYVVTCPSNQQIDADVSLDQVVIVTNCRVNVAGGTSFVNSIIASSSTSSNAFTGNSASRLGADDDCTPGGGAVFITAGSMHFAGNMQIYGSQLIAAGDIGVAAQEDGIEGVSMQTGGDINLTSLSSFGLCNDDADLTLFEDYYRLVA
jgi:Flp pilus assembly protein TadG